MSVNKQYEIYSPTMIKNLKLQKLYTEMVMIGYYEDESLCGIVFKIFHFIDINDFHTQIQNTRRILIHYRNDNNIDPISSCLACQTLELILNVIQYINIKYEKEDKKIVIKIVIGTLLYLLKNALQFENYTYREIMTLFLNNHIEEINIQEIINAFINQESCAKEILSRIDEIFSLIYSESYIIKKYDMQYPKNELEKATVTFKDLY